MAVFTRGDFGAGQRLAASGFVVLGLITFWIYSALRFAAALRAHLERRWREVESRGDLESADPRLAALRAKGFAAAKTAPWAAAALFALSAASVAWWFSNWILVGDVSDYNAILAAVGASSALFYAALLILMLWALGTLRRHEIAELLVREAGAGALREPAAELGEDMVKRWEAQTNRVAAFLVGALPIAFSPAVGAYLYLNGTVWGHELVLPAICFALAALLHVWGTAVLVGLYNGHLAEEARHAGAVHPAGERAAPASAAGDAPPERILAAIMLTDMQGYSKAMERDEARAYGRLVEHNRIMRAAISAHRGREIKTIGDAFLVIFRSAIEAVDCALAAQRGFADYNGGKPEDERILVRIGIHLGDVLLTGNDVFGDGVNVAARIEPLAVPGGICVSEPVFEMVRKKVQLEVHEVEGATLKNIASPPRLYRIRLGS
jgi:class 3 adenylate cyclase